MACNLLTRLFGRRTSRLPDSDNAPTPALPVHTDNNLQPEQSLKQLELNDQTFDDLCFLGCLPHQGSYILSLPDVTPGVNNSNIQTLRDLPGFIGVEEAIFDGPIASVDIFVHFSTAAEAAEAMASNLTITLSNGSIRQLQPDERDSETIERAAKRQRLEPLTPPPKCLVCCEELLGPHIRPCLFCDKRWCYDCLKTNFSVALNDPERFPSQCCGRIVHYDVARGIVSLDDHSKYRTRFEEHSTTKPVYCANPVCSTFLPLRLARPDTQGKVLCFSCQTATCTECREVVQPTDVATHVCTTADQITALVKQFEYKRCPRCNAGVARMYGCSHIRCPCGAHWCWDCERAIHICWSKPCDRAREEGDMTDENGIPAEESDSDDADTLGGSTEALVQPVAPAQDANMGPHASHAHSINPEVVVEEVETRQAILAAQQSSASRPDASEEPSVAPLLTFIGLEEALTISGRIVRDGDSYVDQVTGIIHPSHMNPNAEPPMAPLYTTFFEPPVQSSEPAVPTMEILNGQIVAPRTLPDQRPLPLTDGLPGEDMPPTVLSTTPRLLPSQLSSSELGGAFVNLDSDDVEDWQNGEYDFGDEPLDEPWNTWGCVHHFTPLHKHKIHQYWLPAKQTDVGNFQATRRIDCLKCYKTISVSVCTAEEEKDETERKDSGVEVSAPTLQQADEISQAQDVAADTAGSGPLWKKTRRNKKDGPKLFNCMQCGIIYCSKCKKDTVRELRASLESNTAGVEG